jgi:hypothetical protein
MTVPPYFMIKLLIPFIAAICFTISVHAQQTAADSIPVNKDSLEKEIDEFLKVFDSLQKPKSYFLVGVGIGNNQFSSQNVTLNSQQSSFIVNLSPTISYQNKNGLGVSYNNFIATGNGSSELIQHGITPSFDYKKDKGVSFYLSYTRYFGKKESSQYTTPYKNDLFGYAKFGKWKYQPGFMLGFANGSFKEIFSIPLINRKDTATIGVKDFSFIPMVEREFSFNGFGKKDYFLLTPSLMFICASSKYDVKPSDRLLLNRPRIAQKIRKDYSQNQPFNLQSLGLNLDATWYIGKFYLNPQIYFDYYLLSGSNKFNALYTVQSGFMF